MKTSSVSWWLRWVLLWKAATARPVARSTAAVIAGERIRSNASRCSDTACVCRLFELTGADHALELTDAGMARTPAAPDDTRLSASS
jgi:hypothetical protein